MKYFICIAGFLLLQSACSSSKAVTKSQSKKIAFNSDEDIYFLEKDISTVTLDSLMTYDTLVFSSYYHLDDFITLLESERGVIKLHRLPEFSFDHFIDIENNQIDYKLKEIQAATYRMMIQYFKNSGKDAMIKKIIQVI